ncbi:MAG: heme-binding domain-containing protein [Caldilineaceae bacterium]
MKRFLRNAGLVIIGLLIIIQFIPLQRTNPPVTREVNWDSPETRALAQRACFDCHSNETVWPWYAYVAPVSLQVTHHVTEGREHLNFSAWDQPNENFNEIEKAINGGEMPTWDYLLMHSAAKLSDAEKQALLDGLRATLANDQPVARQRGPRR